MMQAGGCESAGWRACWGRDLCTAPSVAGILTKLKRLDAISALLVLGLSKK